MFNLLEYLGYRAYSIFSRILPLCCAYRLADLVGCLVFRFLQEDKMERAIIMRRIYAGKINFYSAYRLVYRNIQLFNRDLVNFFRSGRLNKWNIDSFIRVEGIGYIDDALKEGRGVIFASAHMGSWEMDGIVSGVKGYPVYGMVWKAKNKLVSDMFSRIRLKKGVGTVERSSLRHVLELLQKNKIIGIMLDVDGGEKGIPYPLWGYSVRLPRGPAAISRDTGAVLLIAITMGNKGGGYTLHIEKPELTGSEEEITVRLFEIIKKYIERDPTQWHWIKYFFEG